MKYTLQVEYYVKQNANSYFYYVFNLLKLFNESLKNKLYCTQYSKRLAVMNKRHYMQKEYN